jgi:hypothetical protein
MRRVFPEEDGEDHAEEERREFHGRTEQPEPSPRRNEAARHRQPEPLRHELQGGEEARGPDRDLAPVTQPGQRLVHKPPRQTPGADDDVRPPQENELQFGARPADNDMCTPDKRPTALSPLKMKKQ